MSDTIKWPFGKAKIEAPVYAATVALTISNAFTIIQLALTGACTLDLTVSAELDPGAIVVIRAGSDGTARDLTLGAGINGPVITGTISKIKSQAFFLDSDGVFKPMGAFAQVD